MKSSHFFAILTILALPFAAFSASPAEESARGVLRRVTGAPLAQVRMEVIPAEGGRDVYEYEARDGVLTLRGSSAVALCRGFYDYAKANALGMVSWAEGRHLRIPPRWPDAPKTRLATPFAIRHAYNVVTAGYTFPYWTWERWERELDWQAMRGFNMLMAPAATEAIQERVWLKLGMTQPEIDAATCGPAHLPWYRMGNICGLDGFLDKQWHAGQVALQHKILDRMRELGMEPVVQSFAGFVPKAGYARLHPESQLMRMHWGGFPDKYQPVMLSADDPQFAAITKSYMDEWHREFGAARYFLADSFNEMAVPGQGQAKAEFLRHYGEKAWAAIHAADPEAVWTLQGWGFYGWSDEMLAALFKTVPEDRLFLLNYLHDYYQFYGHRDTGPGCRHLFEAGAAPAFEGRSWAVGYVPNMGGKTHFTGDLGLYSSISAKIARAPGRGNLVGFTLEGEALENNEMLYELLTDMAWSSEPIDLDHWFAAYGKTRYGACPPAVVEAWQLLRQGCYGNLHDHPRFNWQRMRSSMDRNPNFYTAAEKFLSAAGELGQSPLYRADAIEMAALALSLKADDWYGAAQRASNMGDDAAFDQASARALELLAQVDRLMEAHPYHRLERWIDFARANGATPEKQREYEANAKTLVTYWGWAPGIQNYSSRVWGGLVRDYYREWMRLEFDSWRHGTPFDANKFMGDYVKTVGVSPFTPCADPVADAKAWLKQAMAEKLPEIAEAQLASGAEAIATWMPAQVPADWQTIEWGFSPERLARLKAVQFVYTGDARGHRLEIKSVEVVADGKVVAADKHFGFAGIPNQGNFYRLRVPAGTTGNNGCIIRAVVKGGGGTNSKGTVGLILDKKDNR